MYCLGLWNCYYNHEICSGTIGVLDEECACNWPVDMTPPFSYFCYGHLTIHEIAASGVFVWLGCKAIYRLTLIDSKVSGVTIVPVCECWSWSDVKCFLISWSLVQHRLVVQFADSTICALLMISLFQKLMSYVWDGFGLDKEHFWKWFICRGVNALGSTCAVFLVQQLWVGGKR